MSNSAKNVALLAPVPLEHLIDGAKVVLVEGKVAFGSRAWEVFRELDALRQGLPVEVYIYASHASPPGALEASWIGRYIGHVESAGGAHPAGMRFRPASTGKYIKDNLGKWAVFWELDLLEELPVSTRPRVTEFTGFGKQKRYAPFVPEGRFWSSTPSSPW
jgi:hypothetical protein